MEQQQPTPQAPRQITGVVRNGRLDIDLPPEWEGQVVQVYRAPVTPTREAEQSAQNLMRLAGSLNPKQLPEHLRTSSWSREEIYQDEDLGQ